MKVLAIDVETTGLDPINDMTLSIGAVVLDLNDHKTPIDELPSFHRIFQYPRIGGDVAALAVHKDLISRINASFSTSDSEVAPPEDIPNQFSEFLMAEVVQKRWNGRSPIITGAGKNFAGVDRRFIEKWFPAMGVFHYKTLDPGPLFFDPSRDEEVPSLAECVRRTGVNKRVSHNALNDARLVAEVLRYYFSEEVFPIEDEGSLLSMDSYNK